MSRMNGLSFWGPGKAFSPTNIVNLSAWYDPSDLSTLWQDTGATTPAGVGDAVARMDDKSGNGRHATQATSGSRPVLRQDAGGRYYLEPDGSDDNMEVPVGTIDYTGSISVWTGYALDDANSDSTPQLFGGTSSTGFNIWHLSGTGKPRLFTTEDGTALTNSLDYETPLTDNEAIVRGDVHSDSAGKAMRIAGQDVVSNSTAYAALDEPSACYLFGDASSQNLAGAFYGMAIYNGLLTDAEKTSLDLYYANKIGDTGMAKSLLQNMLDFFAADTSNDVTDDFSSYADTAALEEVWTNTGTGSSSIALDAANDEMDLTTDSSGNQAKARRTFNCIVGKRYTISVTRGADGKTTSIYQIFDEDNNGISGTQTVTESATSTYTFVAPTPVVKLIVWSEGGANNTTIIASVSIAGTATTGAMYDFTDFDAMAANSGFAVTASDAVAKVLDKSKGLALGEELFDLDSNVNVNPTHATRVGDTIIVDIPSNNNAAFAQTNNAPIEAGKLYRVEVTVDSYTSGSLDLVVGSTTYAGDDTNDISSTGTYVAYLVPDAAGEFFLNYRYSFPHSYTVSGISCREVLGYHLYQDTAGSRPVAANDADGNSLDFDGSDDYLTALDPDDDLAISGDLVIAVVAKADNDANVKTIMAAGDSTIATDTAYQMFMDGSEQVGLEQADATNSEAETTTLAASATTSLLELQRDGASVDFWKDEDSTEAETFATVTSPTAGTTIETLVGVHVDESSEPFAGSIQAVFVANRIWTLTEHVRLRAYFQSLTEADVT